MEICSGNWKLLLGNAAVKGTSTAEVRGAAVRAARPIVECGFVVAWGNRRAGGDSSHIWFELPLL